MLLGAQLGTVVSMPISGYLAANYSWEVIFYVFGILGMIWFIFWTYLISDTPEKHSSITKVSFFFIIL